MRWLRLDVSWDDSPWVFVLSIGSQLAWIKLLCYVKAYGSAGSCKALSDVVAAKKWAVGSEDVQKMLQAGVSDGAIKISDGQWTIVNWSKYQETDSTAAERQRRRRAKSVTERHGVTTVTKGVTRHATETGTETVKKTPSESKSDGVGKEFFDLFLEQPCFHGGNEAAQISALTEIVRDFSWVGLKSLRSIAKKCRDYHATKHSGAMNVPIATKFRDWLDRAESKGELERPSGELKTACTVVDDPPEPVPDLPKDSPEFKELQRRARAKLLADEVAV